MARTEFVMHTEAKRNWWSGTSTTVCGLTFKVEKATRGGRVTCPACARINQETKNGKGGKR